MNAPNRWQNADLLRAAVLFFATWVLLRFLWVTRSVVLMTVLAILLGVTLSRGVDFLQRFRINRALGAILILGGIFGIIIGAGFLVAPSLEKQSRELAQKFPAAIDRLEKQVRRQPLANAALSSATQQGGQQQQSQSPQSSSEQKRPPHAGPPSADPHPKAGAPGSEKQQDAQSRPESAAAPQPSQGSQPRGGAQSQQQSGAQPQQQSGSGQAGSPQKGSALLKAVTGHAGSFAQMLFPFLANSLAAIAGVIVVLFVAAYFAIEPHVYRSAIVRLVPPDRRDGAEALLDELKTLLSQWLVARVSAMVIIGLLTAGGLALIGVPAAGALGVIAGLLEFIPFVGPIVSAVPAIAMAVVASPTKALWVVVLFLVLQQIEGNVVTPLLMKNRLEVPPAVTILAVAALGIVFGILGMLIAEPLSAAVILIAKRLYVRKIENGAETQPVR